jgi:hypothetical protein
MSLVVAKQIGNNILVVSDTKLSEKNLDKKYFVQNENPRNGVLKAVIINEKVCICFAGGNEYARDAFLKIHSGQTISQILDVLLNSHLSSKGGVDFILCANVESPCIYEVKDNSIKPTNSSWIGDYDAYKKFTSGLYKDQEKIISGDTLKGELFDRMIPAMDKVINDSSIHTVGGYRVSLSIKQNIFQYDFYMTTHFAPKTVVVKAGEFYPLGHDNADVGGYTLTFIGASIDHQHVAFHIRQGKIGVLYSRNNGLMEPRILSDMDEVDFHDHIIPLGIRPIISTVDRFDKYRNQAIQLFRQQLFEDSILNFDKAMRECKGEQKAEMLYYKGLALHYLNRHQEAVKVFQESIGISVKYQPYILQIITGKGKK